MRWQSRPGAGGRAYGACRRVGAPLAPARARRRACRQATNCLDHSLPAGDGGLFRHARGGGGEKQGGGRRCARAGSRSAYSRISQTQGAFCRLRAQARMVRCGAPFREALRVDSHARGFACDPNRLQLSALSQLPLFCFLSHLPLCASTVTLVLFPLDFPAPIKMLRYRATQAAVGHVENELLFIELRTDYNENRSRKISFISLLCSTLPQKKSECRVASASGDDLKSRGHHEIPSQATDTLIDLNILFNEHVVHANFPKFCMRFDASIWLKLYRF